MGDSFDGPSQTLTGPKYKLLEACRHNAYEENARLREADIHQLINDGADVNITDNEGKTALFYAVQKSDNKFVVHALIDVGADVNITDNKGKTAFFYAVQKSDDESIVNALIKRGADVNKKDKEGKTALFYANQERLWHYQNLLCALIDAGADVNTIDDDGKTALFYAVQQSNNGSIVCLLISKGADVNITDSKGKTALFYTVVQSSYTDYFHSVFCALINAGADVNKTDNEGKTSLHHAWEDGNILLVLQLIDASADLKVLNNINMTNEDGKSLLIRAIESGHMSSAERIARGGADVNIVDKNGKTALFYAVQQRTNRLVVHALIDAGADVNITDNEGKTALFYAVRQSIDEQVACALVDAGAHLKVRDDNFKTPLFYAITESGSIVSELLKTWASLHQKHFHSVLTFLIGECYKLPGDLRKQLRIIAEQKMASKTQILEALVSFAFCIILSFNQSSYSIDICSLSALLRLAGEYTSMFDVRKVHLLKKILKTIDEQEKRVLMKPEVISKMLHQLVKLGANQNCADLDGNTALHHAIQLSSYDVPKSTVLYICKQLEEMGASFNIKNCKKETPLLHCLVSIINKLPTRSCQKWSEVQTQLAVCQFLIKHGSNVEEKEQHGQSSLHLILELLRQVLLCAHEESRTRCLDEVIQLLQNMLIAQKKKGLPVVIIDDSGNTPLHIMATFELAPGQDYSRTIAEGYTFQGLLKMILNHFNDDNKPQLHLKNESGETPLHMCRTWTAIELFLDAGVNPNDWDSSGRSPLLVAAKTSEFVKNQGSFYPDIVLAHDKFWRKVLSKGFDLWMVDIHNESVLSVLMESESHDLARALVDVACDDSKVRSHPLILFSLLTAICRDKLPNAQWKKDAAEMILSSTNCPVNGNDREDSPLHYCCRNIIEVKKSSSTEVIKSTVHWKIVKLLRSFGADYRIPDATDQSCLNIAEQCPALKDLLMEPIDLDRFPLNIKPWKSVSKTHERCLTKVARHLESEHVEPYWYHKDHLAFGSFGAVYAGINEKDGREVAIKRIEKIRMPRPEDQREIKHLTALTDCEQIVRYLSFFEDKGFTCIVLELMEGNLEDLLDKSITMKKREELCIDVLKGLSYMHGKGYLHRDLKPTNILFKNSPKLCLKIADFGLSRRSDSTPLTTVYGTNAGTRCWIAPEVLKGTKNQHSAASDMFSCGLALHYFLSVKKHPFSPEDCTNKSESLICYETETNVMLGNKEGWDNSLSPEAAYLLEKLLESDAKKRPTAEESLSHPLFWSKTNKMDFLAALGNQPEFECPRAKRTHPLTAIETDLETSFGTIVKYEDWNGRGYAHMPAIYTEMKKKRKYVTHSVVELVRFIRNAYSHVTALPKPIPDQLLKDYVFLEYFPNLVIEVYKAVTTHGWDQTREEIKYFMKK